jgi:hypothetical protein
MVYLLFFLADALVIEKRDNLSIVAFPLQRIAGTPASQKFGLHKRSFQSTLLDFYSLSWILSISLGTPPRTMYVQLDTGSSDLVVETDSSDYCTSNPSFCSVIGTCTYSPPFVRRKLTKEQMTLTAHLHTFTSIVICKLNMKICRRPQETMLRIPLLLVAWSLKACNLESCTTRRLYLVF